MKIDRILNNELELLDIVEWGESGGLGEPTEPTETEIQSTVGEEFVEWAEKYWRLKENYDIPNKEFEESQLYEHIRNIFIHKIDEIIKKRL